MSISNYFENQCYCIKDFRYSNWKQPNRLGEYTGGDQRLLDSEIVEKYKAELFDKIPHFNSFLKREKEGNKYAYIWSTNDGVILADCDRPFDEQTNPNFKDVHYLSYHENMNLLKN